MDCDGFCVPSDLAISDGNLQRVARTADAGLGDSGPWQSPVAGPDAGPEAGREVGSDTRGDAAEKGRDSNPSRDAGPEISVVGDARPAIDAHTAHDERPGYSDTNLDSASAVPTPVQLVVTPASSTIQAQVGYVSDVEIILQNQGATEIGQLAFTLSSTTDEYAIAYSSCTGSLAPQAQCSLHITFAPKKTGESRAVLAIAVAGNSPIQVKTTLEGTAHPISPGFIGPSDLGTAVAGSSCGPITYAVAGTGGLGIEITTSDPRFVISNNTCSTVYGNPDTCTFDITFKSNPTDAPVVYSAMLKLAVAGNVYTLSSRIVATVIPAS